MTAALVGIQFSNFPPGARGGNHGHFIGYYCAVKGANLTAEVQFTNRGRTRDSGACDSSER